MLRDVAGEREERRNVKTRHPPVDADARTRTRGRTRGEKALIEGVVRASLLVLDRDAREEEEEEEEGGGERRR